MPKSTRVEAPKRTAYSAERRKLVVRSSLIGRTEAIPGAAHGVDQLGRKAAVDLAAQAADMGLDDIGLRVEVKFPDVLQQHSAGDDAAGVAHEIFEKLELLRLQLDALPGARDAALEEI